jgi:hypothetical protein
LRPKWTKEEIIAEIQEMERRGVSLNPGLVKRTHTQFYDAACNHFRSWKRAAEAAGVEYQRHLEQKSPDYWTKDRILKEIIELGSKGENLNQSYASVSHSSLLYAAEHRFGTWKKAVEQAGFSYDSFEKRKQKMYSKDEDAFLIRNYQSLSILDIAGALERSRASVMNRAKHLGVSKVKNPPWTEKELIILQNPDLTVLEKIGTLPYRSMKQVRGVIEYRGYKSKPPEIVTKELHRRGYIFIKKTKDGKDHGERQHRIIASQMLGRPLKSNETVHHIDMDKLDNRPENLLISSRIEHGLVHGSLGRIIKELLESNIIRFDNDLGYVLNTPGGGKSG